ncbi:excinuclease ABC subunit C [Leptolyngbya sp. NIES-3755]|nr:excinuclease ABC subunit C [Leptolyngbya sp. NIES-3755]
MPHDLVEKLMIDELIQIEALRILEILTLIKFEECYPLIKTFSNLPARPGIYAVKSRTEGILYIGKAKSVRERFQGGHSALVLAFLERLDPDEIRIAVVTLSPNWARTALAIEEYILETIQPRYNVRLPKRKD